MSRAHIRDVLAITKQDHKQGKVSTVSLCGESDPDMNKLTFARPPAVLDGDVPDPCQKCRRIWKHEQESLNDSTKAKHMFRRQIHTMNNFNRFNKR